MPNVPADLYEKAKVEARAKYVAQLKSEQSARDALDFGGVVASKLGLATRGPEAVELSVLATSKAAGRFTLVKVDTSSDDDPAVVEAVERYQAKTLPTLILLDSSGKLVKKIDHYVEPAELLPLLRQVK